MRKNTARLFLFSSLLSISGMAENRKGQYASRTKFCY